jgi:hypothetical protein
MSVKASINKLNDAMDAMRRPDSRMIQTNYNGRPDFWITPCGGRVEPDRPSIEPLPSRRFQPCRRICESRFSKKFFSKNFCTVGQFAGVRLKASGMAITGTAVGRRK